ncbi:MAG TPA: hypothetical protein DCR93_18105 [Cytophagales bacterium]|nr:hypothetical protein [Cytophagales bacterium]
MVMVAFSAFVLSAIKSNSFLFMVGLFTLYMTVTGRRALKFKKPQQTHAPFDWVFLGATALGAIVFLSVLLTRVPLSHGMMPVIITFGGFLIAMLIGDASYYANLRSNVPKNFWLLRHITRMMGAYIATTTAFIVTNIQSDPAWIAWLAPTVVFSPLITYYKNKYRGKNKKKAPMVQPVSTP